jgi:flagellar motor switch protein FliG
MGVFTRYKKSPEGLRQLVELWETTPLSRRQKMIDVGMQEDPSYTQKVLQYLFTFEDITKLPDLELTEVISETPIQFVGFAVHRSDETLKARFMSKCPARLALGLKEVLQDDSVTPGQVGAGKTKMIEVARQLERKGLIQTKRIPMN